MTYGRNNGKQLQLPSNVERLLFGVRGSGHAEEKKKGRGKGQYLLFSVIRSHARVRSRMIGRVLAESGEMRHCG